MLVGSIWISIDYWIRCQIFFSGQVSCKLVLSEEWSTHNEVECNFREIQLRWFALRGFVFPQCTLPWQPASYFLFRQERISRVSTQLVGYSKVSGGTHPTLDVDTRRADGERWRPTSLMPSRQTRESFKRPHLHNSPTTTRGVWCRRMRSHRRALYHFRSTPQWKTNPLYRESTKIKYYISIKLLRYVWMIRS